MGRYLNMANNNKGNPAKGTTWAMPSVSRMILAALRTTASVRASEAPGGSWIVQAKDPQGAMFALVGRRG